MVPTDCAGDGTPASKGITPCALAAAAPPSPWGWMTTQSAVMVAPLLSSPSTRTLVPLRTSRVGPSTVLVEEVSLTVTSMPVAVVIVKPDAKVVATMPVEPPSDGPLTACAVAGLPPGAGTHMELGPGGV